MIDHKELRIGNYVSTNFDANGILLPTGLPFIVFTIGFSECQLLNDLHAPWATQEPYPAGYNRLEPIPLTPEWLERLGFENPRPHEDDDFLHWNVNGFEIWQHNDGFAHSYHFGGDIKYVHQLQNLYFALTGTELTIKE